MKNQKAYFSCKLGLAILTNLDSEESTYYDLGNDCELDESYARKLTNLSNDWIQSLHCHQKDALSYAAQKYHSERTASQLRVILNSQDETLIEDTLTHIENTLEQHSTAEPTLNALLIAPLKSTQTSASLAQKALSMGLGVTASVIEELNDLQPNLKRLSQLWLNDKVEFCPKTGYTQQLAWNLLLKTSSISRILKSKSQNDFMTEWNLTLFHFENLEDRRRFISAGRSIAEILHNRKSNFDLSLIEKIKEDAYTYPKDKVTNHESYLRANKQISEILRLVSEGRDRKAKRYIKELSKSQKSHDGTFEHGSKSLCNLAQRCAEMYRTDLEAFCLEIALSHNSNDSWTLIQYGNHLKRVGDYDNAIKILNEAYEISSDVIAKSSEADVYSQQAKYDAAIALYRKIESQDNDLVVKTAIADNYRKKNDLSTAQNLYKEILDTLSTTSATAPEIEAYARAKTGIAEVNKRRGDYSTAIETYKEVLELPDLQYTSSIAYKLALCNLHKLNNQLDESYELIDEIVRKNPFFEEARTLRGSILGLLGREKEALLDLPDIKPKAWKEWVRPYYRGILLLKLNRFSEAKNALLTSLQDPTISGQEKATVRMASALFALKNNKLDDVDQLLNFDSSIQDYHNSHLLMVLRFHLATKRKNYRAANKLRKALRTKPIQDESLKSAIKAIRKKHFHEAISFEAEAFLKAA